MRLLLNVLILLMIAAVGVAGHHWYQQSQAHRSLVRATIQARQTIEEQIRYEAALTRAFEEDLKYPLTLDPGWFGPRPPRNRLLDTDAYWVDIAPEGDTGLHPPDPIVTSPRQAAFWYNPANGILRARVPFKDSEAVSLELYNHINNTDLRHVDPGEMLARRPLRQAIEGIDEGQVVNVSRQTPHPTAARASMAFERVETASPGRDTIRIDSGRLDPELPRRPGQQASDPQGAPPVFNRRNRAPLAPHPSSP
ncbi:MAG: hypothetical protein JJU36_10720 [Phycisphaeraceae bacterium]|nr:hypothetical protein [Phycisphaeraceae bacterium]